MALKEYGLFIQVISEWCLTQNDLTGFSFRIDRLMNSLVVTLEWDCGKRVYRATHGYLLSHVRLYKSWPPGMLESLAGKADEARAAMIRDGCQTYSEPDHEAYSKENR